VASWTIKEPTTLTFDVVKKLRIKTISGTVDVVGTDSHPTLEVTSLSGKDLESQARRRRISRHRLPEPAAALARPDRLDHRAWWPNLRESLRRSSTRL
jgi:hypothetical protein